MVQFFWACPLRKGIRLTREDFMMRVASLPTFAGLIAALAAAGCTDLQSSNIKTSGMSAHMTVISDGSGQTTVTAWLHVDNNATDFVTLSSGDTLAATAGTQTQSMSESNFAGDVSYSTTFSSENASGTVYTVALHRASDTSAPGSTCTLPAPYTITSPAVGSTVSVANDIAVTYGAAGTNDSVSYSMSGPCIQGQPGTSLGGDPGTFVIPHTSIQTADAGAALPCQVTLSVDRSRVGTIDPAYGSGGDISCDQSRTVTFMLAP
jgi:hypothetical protein